MLRLAFLFYGTSAGLALLWGALAGRPSLRLWPPDGTRALLGSAAGLALGLLVVLLSRLMVRWWRWGRELFEWFAGLLGPVSLRDAVLLAALSSVGEELFFRGAMQGTFGLWITSAVFALLHFPQQLRLWPWTLSAGLMGLSFGILADWSGHLGGALIAHFVINALNLAEVGRVAARPRGGPEKLPGPEAAPSIPYHEATCDHPPDQPAHHPDDRGGGDGEHGERR